MEEREFGDCGGGVRRGSRVLHEGVIDSFVSISSTFRKWWCRWTDGQVRIISPEEGH